LGTLAASGCGGGSTPEMLPGGHGIRGKTILFVIYSPPSSPWDQSRNAVKAVERITGLEVRVVYVNDTARMIAQIRSGIAAHVAGMALDVYSSGSDAAICAASDAGIPVVAWNSNGYGAGASRCVTAYIGQNFVSAGRAIARYLADHGRIRRGAHVFCPVEDSSATYARERAKGVNLVLAAFGARCDVVSVGDADATNRARMIDYLQRHRDTDLVIALGRAPLANAPAALARLHRRLPVAGFDIADGNTGRIIDGIQNGDIIATVDQQLYSQAFQAVMQLALYLRYGLFPSSINTSDNSVVDSTNAGLAASLSGTYR
jgi:simple sugar transport system substrate-binding protein